MTREQKYPETSTFHYYNANPKNRMTGDCVVRALCTAMGKPYEDVYRELLESALKTGYSIASTENFDRYLKANGWIKNKQPRKADNTKYTGKEFCKELNAEIMAVGKSVIANIGGHHIVCIKEAGEHGFFKVWDIWDSTYKCIGNYWTKG